MSGEDIAQEETNFVDKVYSRLLEERIMKDNSFTGEFGKSGLPISRYRSPEDIPAGTEEETRKKNCTVTILSMEAIERYKNTKEDQDIKKSLEWLHNNLEEEWFIAKVYIADDNATRSLKSYQRIIDIRHTAITMWAIAKYEPEQFKINYFRNVYDNFLKHQKEDKSWSISPGVLDYPDLFSTVFVVKFLNFILNNFESPEDKKEEIQTHRNHGGNWISLQRQEVGGYIFNRDTDKDKLRFTANVLYFLSEMIEEHEFCFLKKAKDYLKRERMEEDDVVYWEDESSVDSEYVSTIHTAAALSSVMDSDVELPGIVDKSKRYLIRGFEKERKQLDAADLAFLLSIFAYDSTLTRRLENVKTYCEHKLSDLHRVETFRYFTKHEHLHSKSILKLLRRLIDYEKLSKYEAFLLDASAWCHDIGMLLRNGELDEIEVIRKNHAKRSGEYIREKWEEMGFSNEPEADLVAKICEVHQSSGELEQVEEETTYRSDKIRLQFLAALLRFADALDADERRLPDSPYRNTAPNDSQDEYDKHEIVREVKINRDANTITLIMKLNSDMNVVRRVKEKIQEEFNCVKPVLEKEEVKFGIQFLLS